MPRSHWFFLSVQVFCLLVISLVSPVDAQESATSDKPEAAAEQEDAVHRLPSHYSEVVTEAQRKTIYEIQDRYRDELREMELQMLALIKKRNAEIENVLSAEQKELIRKVAAESKAQRDRLKGLREQIEAERRKAEASKSGAAGN
ncbi:hypothetical protein [Lignipirellula cremea]|uniref:LTXXQ motif protein n=1 Tax=Lignipirellula cremea TaxID=2528010 RepID=A0A518DVB8_9BACT|nr:hypothetical protein [Lignipirellula cremea]QDU95782.1 hypothetical protein Pla8534_35990 [Lignipirellula cremea]